MGGSSGQVTGYRYFTNFLLFIGNPIENLLGINFDKRGWIYGERVPMGDNGSLIYLESPNLYGENEGGVSGTLNLKLGTNIQTEDKVYKNYMESIGLQASAYPYQSYISFTGGGLSNSLENLTEEQLQELANQYNNGIIPGRGFYVGNSGYMKEMLLWPKRTRIRNDGRRQWHEVRGDGAVVCEIDADAFRPISIQPAAFFDYSVDYTFRGEYQGKAIEGANLEYIENRRYQTNLYVVTSGAFDEDLTASVKIETNQIGLMTIFIAVRSSVNPEGLEWSVTSTAEIISTKTYISDNPSDILYNRVQCEVLLKVFSPSVTTLNFLSPPVFLSENNFYANDLALNPDVQFGFVSFAAFRESSEIQSLDINPIHKIREILTDDTAMNKPESSVNDVNFIKAADRIYDERLGISWAITEKSCIDAINELCYHIEAGIRVNRQTGLYEMVLFRDDWFKEDEMHTIAESKIKSMQYEITNADEVINQVNVNFYDRANIKNSSFSISESGLIQTLGRVNAETVDFPYFMNMRNAEIVANWKLKILSTGVLKGSFTTGWREARKWNRYDLIRLPWSKRWVGTILVRIMSINLGGPTNNEVSIEFIEVVPSTGMMNTTIVADDVIDKPLPPQSCQYEPFELPYYLAVMALGQRQVDDELTYENNFGLVGAVAEKPQENSLYAVMMTNNGDEWIRAGSIQYSQTADLDQIISKTSSSFTVKNWRKNANVAAGTLIKCGRDWLGTPGEWMVFQGVDPYTGIVSVKRGALDTPPQEWGIDTKLYFCGNDISYDQTEYVSGEEVLVSALTTTPSGVLEQSGSIPIEMKARAIRPYPPANVKINGEYFPQEIETDLILTWVDRNRLQQTGGSILGWFDSGVAIEPGTQTHLILTQLGENDLELATTSANLTGATSYTMPISSMQADTRSVSIILKTIRNGYECLNPFIHTVELSQFFSAPYDLTVEFKND